MNLFSHQCKVHFGNKNFVLLHNIFLPLFFYSYFHRSWGVLVLLSALSTYYCIFIPFVQVFYVIFLDVFVFNFYICYQNVHEIKIMNQIKQSINQALSNCTVPLFTLLFVVNKPLLELGGFIYLFYTFLIPYTCYIVFEYHDICLPSKPMNFTCNFHRMNGLNKLGNVI